MLKFLRKWLRESPIFREEEFFAMMIDADVEGTREEILAMLETGAESPELRDNRLQQIIERAADDAQQSGDRARNLLRLFDEARVIIGHF